MVSFQSTSIIKSSRNLGKSIVREWRTGEGHGGEERSKLRKRNDLKNHSDENRGGNTPHYKSPEQEMGLLKKQAKEEALVREGKFEEGTEFDKTRLFRP